MALKKYKPYTPSRRFMVGYDFSDITTQKPEKSLTVFIGKTGGRNNQGRITSRRMGGGNKRLYRVVDFRGYDKVDIPAKVASIEYDPYRTSRIALLNYADGEKRYVIARNGISVGNEVMYGEKAPIANGNRKQLKDIPEGMNVHCLEITPFSTGKIIKTAGSSALISGRDEAQGLVFIKMPSGEVRKFNQNCRATIGTVGNEQHKNVVIGKAGRQRRKGIKPRVLGKNMNPKDHPHGGGEAHSPIGLKFKAQKSFSGKRVAAGIRTRNNKKWSTRFIVSRRKTK
jgi:large subunit ribosomal protein L2